MQDLLRDFYNITMRAVSSATEGETGAGNVHLGRWRDWRARMEAEGLAVRGPQIAELFLRDQVLTYDYYWSRGEQATRPAMRNLASIRTNLKRVGLTLGPEALAHYGRERHTGEAK